jgi:hypothetical protein
MVMSLAIAGSAFGPYQLLSLRSNQYVQPATSWTVSGPGAALAAWIANRSDTGSPSPAAQAAVNVCADAAVGHSASGISARLARVIVMASDGRRAGARRHRQDALSTRPGVTYLQLSTKYAPCPWPLEYQRLVTVFFLV